MSSPSEQPTYLPLLLEKPFDFQSEAAISCRPTVRDMAG
jgi:hypothetical protein